MTTHDGRTYATPRSKASAKAIQAALLEGLCIKQVAGRVGLHESTIAGYIRDLKLRYPNREKRSPECSECGRVITNAKAYPRHRRVVGVPKPRCRTDEEMRAIGFHETWRGWILRSKRGKSSASSSLPLSPESQELRL